MHQSLKITWKTRFELTNQSYSNTFTIEMFFLKCITVLNHRKQKVQLQVIHSYSNISFMTAHVFTFLEILINISPNGIELPSCILSFHFSGLPSISCRSGLAVTNSLGFYLSGNVLISLSFLKGNFAGYRILG